MDLSSHSPHSTPLQSAPAERDSPVASIAPKRACVERPPSSLRYSDFFIRIQRVTRKFKAAVTRRTKCRRTSSPSIRVASWKLLFCSFGSVNRSHIHRVHILNRARATRNIHIDGTECCPAGHCHHTVQIGTSGDRRDGERAPTRRERRHRER